MTHQRPDVPAAVSLSLEGLDTGDAAGLGPGDEREAELLTVRSAPELDWTRVTLRECQVQIVGVARWLVDRSRLLECRLLDLDVTVLRARDVQWRTVEIVGGRLPALDLAGATWDAVGVTGARLGYVNLRDATLTDVAFTDCRIETLDLGAATAVRVSLRDCTVDELIVTRATLRDVDLRAARIELVEGVAHLTGATVSADQLLELAPALAAALGIAVAPDD
ncbi:MAG: hypothetical protein WCF36_07970 [Candidatus Nanopelagicales bacterium]